MLIDEGGEISLINAELVKQIPVEVRPTVRPITLDLTAFSSPLTVIGAIELPVRIAGIEEMHRFVVLQEVQTRNLDVLLGNDFTSKNDLYIRVYQEMGYFHGESLKIYKSKHSYTRGRLYCQADTNIPESSTLQVQVKLEGSPLCGPIMCADPIPSWPYMEDIIVQAAVIDLRNPQLYLKLVNNGSAPIEIKKGETFATLRPVDKVTEIPSEDDDSCQNGMMQACICSISVLQSRVGVKKGKVQWRTLIPV